MRTDTDVVTGSFSYTGQYITRRLLALGRSLRTLTGHAQAAHPLASRITVFPYNFDHPDRLTESLRGADALYNTYWVRFPYRRLDYETAVGNLQTLINAAVQAEVRKIVHISIINPSEKSPFAYFRGKAQVERAIKESGLEYTILRPTVVFGPEDILINNIAWMIRTFPVFMMPGSGNYRMQPIYVEDLAAIAVDRSASPDSEVLDAAGPEIFKYRELIKQIAHAIGRRVLLADAPATVVYGISTLLGWFLHDVVLTYEEILALKDNLLYSDSPPLGTTRLSNWLVSYKDQLGREYRSEIRRHF